MSQGSTKTAISFDSAPEDSGAATSTDVEKLRSILVQPEREKLKQLQEQLNALQFKITDEQTRINDASEVLVEATNRAKKRDDTYSNTLKPVVVEQFQSSARENPEIMAEALFPILGPAIRKMIANMLSRDSNKTKRTYKFEQLFLIEKESGLPICHATSGAAEAQDADMVSGMLSAIQSFVHDAFSTQEFDGLNTLQLGELSVWIEWGPSAVIAAVIRGVAPEHCRTALQQLNEDIHSNYAEQLDNYNGDDSSFSDIKSDFVLFMDNHDSRLRNRVRNLPERARRNLVILGIATALLLGWLVLNQLDKRKWNAFVAKLDSQPGIVVTSSSRSRNNYTVKGLRDPLAISPIALTADSGLDPDEIVFELEPYQALNTDFNLQRIKSVLTPSEGVSLSLDGTVLNITGATSKSWMNNAKRLALQFSQVTHVTFGPVEK